MSFPGKPGQPGGWSPEPPPRPPFGAPPAAPESPAYQHDGPPPHGADREASGHGGAQGAGGLPQRKGFRQPGDFHQPNDPPPPGDFFPPNDFPPPGGPHPPGGDFPGAGFHDGGFQPGPDGDPGGYSSLEGGDFGTPGGRPPAKKRTNLPLIILGSAVAGLLLVGGGFGLSTVLKGDSKPKAKATTPAPAPTTSVPTTPPPVKINAKLRSRATDPQPLSLNEIFGKSSFTYKGQKYLRTNRHVTRNCAGTVSGARFSATLKKAGCTQALRATFARRDGKLIGTLGVLNLRTEKAAKATRLAGTSKDTFLKALPGGGVTKKIGQGAALGTVEVRGHYILMTWIQRPDGKTIPAAQHRYVSAFGQQVEFGTNLSRALYYRGLEGKPLRG